MKRYTKPVIICVALIVIILFSMQPARSDYYTINATRIALRVQEGNIFVDVFKIDDQKCLRFMFFSGNEVLCYLDNGSPT